MSDNGTSTVTTYPAYLFNEYTIALEGSSVACILFGVYLVLAGTNLSLLQKKRYRVLLGFTITQLILTTIYFAISLYAAPAQSLSIFGIQSSYGIEALSPWPTVIVSVMFVLNTWCSDAFLLYRCYVVWMGNKSAIAIPAAIYLATLGSSLAWLVVGSMPGAVYSTIAVQNTGIVFWSCSAAMNVCASLLIAARLWMHRQAIAHAVGSQLGGFYLGYMAMTLESALLYTVFVIIALIAFTTNSPLQNVFFPVLGTVQVIAPSLIIYRIASGVSFETDKRGSVATGSLRFSPSRRQTTLLRPIRKDMNGSETMQVMTEVEAIKTRDGSNSFIHEVKEDVGDQV